MYVDVGVELSVALDFQFHILRRLHFMLKYIIVIILHSTHSFCSFNEHVQCLRDCTYPCKLHKHKVCTFIISQVAEVLVRFKGETGEAGFHEVFAG